MTAPDRSEATRFVTARDRDASASIRGFVYQVDLTIERWLELQETDVLELECGEDIDRVARALDAPADQFSRLLEQVKHREENLTLRSPEARAFLANAFEHAGGNPGLRLTFRYTTNASPGVERPSLLPGGEPALLVWNALRVGALDESTGVSNLEVLRQLLTSDSTPEGVQPMSWTAFQMFVRTASPHKLMSFVRCVEWSLMAPQAVELAPHIRAHLRSRGHAENEAEAEELHHRLFARVWRVLSTPGEKRLTRHDLLLELQRSTVSETDRLRLERVRMLVEMLAARVEVLERGVTELAVAQSISERRLEVIAREAGVRSALTYELEVPVLDEPPLVELCSTREESVRSLLESNRSKQWLAIHGASGSGKTQLAILIARAITPEAASRVWIRFRDLGNAQSARRLDYGVARVARSASQEDPSPTGLATAPPLDAAVARSFVQQLGAGACVVLDDLPRYAPDDELGARLMILALACRDVGVQLVTTSVYALPDSVSLRLPQGGVGAAPAPPLTVSEMGELFAAHGASPSALGLPLVAMATTATRGHPVLAQALARLLAKRGWPTGADAWTALLGKDYVADVNEETLERVLQTVVDSTARGLLARLTLITGDFDLQEVVALAAVAPEIDQPRARFQSFTGLWVQREAEQLYTVSPLARELGPVDLRPETIRECHSVIARRLTARDTINHLQFLQAFSHLLQAEEVNFAGLLLLRGLVSMNRKEPPFRDPIILSLWVDSPLPTAMPPGLRMILRAVQIVARDRAGFATDELQTELDQLIHEAAPDDEWCVFAASSFLLGRGPSERNVRMTLRYVGLMAQTWPSVEREAEKHGRPVHGFDLSILPWLGIDSFRSGDDVHAWLDMLAELPSDIRRKAFSHEVAFDASLQAAYSLVAAEEKRPAEGRKWQTVLEVLLAIEESAHRFELEILWAAAIAVRAIVVGQHQDDLVAAQKIVVAALETPNLTSEARFLLLRTMGLLYLDASDHDTAEPWLLAAQQLRPNAFPRDYIKVALWAAALAGRTRPAEGTGIALDTASFSEKRLPPGDLLNAIAHGECAIALWSDGDRTRAFAEWDVAMQGLVDHEDRNDEWRSLVVIMGHVAGYFSAVARTGVPPVATSDGGRYRVPERGMLLPTVEARAKQFKPDILAYLSIHLAHFAEAAGVYERAAVWAERATLIAHDVGESAAVYLASQVLLTQHLTQGDYEGVVAQAKAAAEFELGRAQLLESPSSILEGPPKSGEATAQCEGDSAPSGPDSEKRLQAEARVAVGGVLPIAFRLAMSALRGDPELSAITAQAAQVVRSFAWNSMEPRAWEHAATLLERRFTSPPDFAMLVAEGNGLVATLPDTASAFRSIAYLAATLDPRADLRSVATAHLSVVVPVDKLFGLHPWLYHSTLLDFFVTYWTRAFERARFRFTAPRLVEARLAAISTEPPAIRLRSLFKVITRALGVRLAPHAAEWLRTAES